MAISGDTVQKILSLLRPHMMFEKERLAYLIRALGIDAAVLYRLEWNTPVNVFIPNMVKELVTCGEIAFGKSALCALLEVIREDVGKEQQLIIDELIKKVTEELEKKKLIKNSLSNSKLGSFDIYSIKFLNIAFQAAKAVVYLKVWASTTDTATGFMIAPNLLMTCNYVIGSSEQAEQTEYIFNYQEDINGNNCPINTVQALPEGAFYTNSKLDYTIVTLKEVSDIGKPLILKNSQMKVDDRLTIIHHPGGGYKQISMRNIYVAYADTNILQYTKSTLPGSGGSPVFNDEFAVVAIHQSSGNLLEPNAGKPHMRSQGTSMIAVLKDLQANAPEIYARLYG
ncbi:trypsin-like peptidase domain-containing protein [Leptolyngbya sp. FACHB-671]|uniref:trypsin-like peptidase domain-containing protein n=1 Tax=Leptolyngbya sp. FACHB-671 TaxID=2692812 RepID=UPI001683E3C3|nr:trypsin-like peptidase domain-containing protein [Leptolyngbya sp. FACHB-671]MBD2066000.1 trypsin-like peptidase domain-containing protein [Leptolyngbya sp. FACHB-671]